MQKCRQKNPNMNTYSQMGDTYYSKKYRQCVEDENYDFKQKYTVSKSKIQLCDSQIDKYKGEYKKWKGLEDNRDEYYYNKKESTDSTASSSSRNSDGSYTIRSGWSHSGKWSDGRRLSYASHRDR